MAPTALLEAPVKEEEVLEQKHDLDELVKEALTASPISSTSWVTLPDDAKWTFVPGTFAAQVHTSLPKPSSPYIATQLGPSWLSTHYLASPPTTIPGERFYEVGQRYGHYSFSEDDLARYLDTKGDDDIIGRSSDMNECMVAQALRQMYPDVGNDIRVGVYDQTYVGGREVHLSPTVIQAIHIFDTINPGYTMGPITKREFTQAWARTGLPPLTTHVVESRAREPIFAY